MMAAPRQRPPVWSQRTRPLTGPSTKKTRRPDNAPGVRRRRFILLVVIPVLLMLGSVYLHTVSAELGARAEALREQRAGLEAEKERLEVQVSELSAPGRIRAAARGELQMRDPRGADIQTYGRQGEDGTRNGGEQAKKGAG